MVVNAAVGQNAGLRVRYFSRQRSVRTAAERAYLRVVEQARQPAFFAELGVPDTLDGRFELICLHAFLYLHRLKSEPRSVAVSQAFFDTMFADMDRGLREMGTGDLSVGRHVKRMAQAFYGRIRAYQQGLESGEVVLDAALARNLFGTAGESASAAAAAGRYVRRAAHQLAQQATVELLEGEVRFPPADFGASLVDAAELVASR